MSSSPFTSGSASNKFAPFLLQIASDIHLESLPDDPGFSHNLLKPAAPNLALLGDIGNPGTEAGFSMYRDFLLLQASRFERVFVLCGNHEFYSAKEEIPVSLIKDRIREVCALRPNLFFLDQTSLIFDNVRVIGCTLWTNVGEDDRGSVGRVMRDYMDICVYDDSAKGRLMQGRYLERLAAYEAQKQAILEKEKVLFGLTGIATPPAQLFKNLSPPDPSNLPTRKLRVADTIQWHQQELEWIRKELSLAAELGQTAVVLTHHAPIFQADLKRDSTSAAFATDLSQIFNPEEKGHSPIALWAFGHTHVCSDQVIGQTRVVSNPHGYHGAMQGFGRAFVVDVGVLPLSAKPDVVVDAEAEEPLDLS